MSVLLAPHLTAPSAPRLGVATAGSPMPSPGGPASSSRADRFLARIEKHLPTLSSDAERRSFLNQQIAGAEFRHERFILTDGRSEVCTDPENPIQLSDLTLTIVGLVARRDQLGRVS